MVGKENQITTEQKPFREEWRTNKQGHIAGRCVLSHHYAKPAHKIILK